MIKIEITINEREIKEKGNKVIKKSWSWKCYKRNDLYK